jgi:hypothetical protein
MDKSVQKGKNVELMLKRREQMEDGRRYIIYYTFEPAESPTNEQTEQDSQGTTGNV